MRIAIVGNGVAGIEAALAVRAREPSWEITIVSEESDHFFSRCALMWICTGQLKYRETEPYERDLYQRMKFDRVRARAIGLDAREHRLLLAGAPNAIGYDRLLIASGSRPRPPPWPNSDLLGIGHFVTLQDLDWLEREVFGGAAIDRPPRPDAHASDDRSSPYRPRPAASEQRKRTAKRPAVIGGGLIGMEVVEVLLAAKLEPKFLIKEEWFWPVALDRPEAAFVTERMKEHGVEMLTEQEVEEFEGGDGLVSALVTDRARHEVDLVVVAIGVVPNTEWLKSSGLELDEMGGLVVDETLATSDESIVAAGDCASVRWWNGARRPEQLWYTARQQGRIAGRRLLGDSVRYDRGVWFNSAKMMDVEYTTAGLVGFDLPGEENWRFEETGRVKSSNRIVAQDGRVVGFNMLGRRWNHELFIRWIEERRTLDWVLEHLELASFDTELVPPLVIPKEKQWTSKDKKG